MAAAAAGAGVGLSWSLELHLGLRFGCQGLSIWAIVSCLPEALTASCIKSRSRGRTWSQALRVRTWMFQVEEHSNKFIWPNFRSCGIDIERKRQLTVFLVFKFSLIDLLFKIWMKQLRQRGKILIFHLGDWL